MSYSQYPSCEMQGYGFGEIPPYYDMNMCPQTLNNFPYGYFPPDQPYQNFFPANEDYPPRTPVPTPCTPIPNAFTQENTTNTSQTSNNRMHTNWDDSESGRRSLSKLLKCDYKFKDSKYLIFFTYSILADKNNKDIVWRDEGAGRFFIRNPKNFAQAWGRYKGNSKMNYSNVARSLRYYYTTGLLTKSEGLREYTWDREVLTSLREKFKSSAPLVRREQVCSNSN